MSEQQRRDRRAGDEVVQPQDLSMPMWVWTLLGFVLVVAVIIVVIIIGGGRQTTPGEQDTGGQPETMSTTEPAEPETMPAEAPPLPTTTTGTTKPG